MDSQKNPRSIENFISEKNNFSRTENYFFEKIEIFWENKFVRKSRRKNIEITDFLKKSGKPAEPQQVGQLVSVAL